MYSSPLAPPPEASPWPAAAAAQHAADPTPAPATIPDPEGGGRRGGGVAAEAAVIAAGMATARLAYALKSLSFRDISPLQRVWALVSALAHTAALRRDTTTLEALVPIPHQLRHGSGDSWGRRRGAGAAVIGLGSMRALKQLELQRAYERAAYCRRVSLNYG